MNTPHQNDDALIEGLARVIGVDGNHVWLKAEQPSACSSCGTRSKCNSGTTQRAANWRVPRSLGQDQLPLALGDTVNVGVDRSALTRASLTAYMLPLVTMLIAASTVQGAGDVAGVVAAFMGLLLGVAVARVLTRRWRDALVPVVLGRAVAAEGTSCASSDAGSLRGLNIPVINRRSL